MNLLTRINPASNFILGRPENPGLQAGDERADVDGEAGMF